MQITSVENLYEALDTGINRAGLTKKEIVEKIGSSQKGFYASYNNKTLRFQTILEMISLLKGVMTVSWAGDSAAQAGEGSIVPDNELLHKYIHSLEDRIKDKDRLIESLYKQIDGKK